MPGSDVLGYPPNNFRRKHLEDYYLSVFGALDIGTPEFATFNDFLIDNQDRTYEDAKQLLFSYASSDIISDLKDISEEEKKLESQQEEYLTEELSKLEIGGMALDKMNRDKAEIERLKAENAELKKRPKKITRKKAEPALISKPPTKLEQFEKTVHASYEQGNDFKKIEKLLLEDDEENVQKAKEMLTNPSTDITDWDRKQLESLLDQVERGVKVMVQPKVLHKKPSTFQPKEPFRLKRKTEKEESQEDDVERFIPVIHEVRKLDVKNAKAWLHQYKAHLRKILELGLPVWMVENPQAASFPLTVANMRVIVQVVERYLTPAEQSAKQREIEARRFLSSQIYIIIQFGVGEGIEKYDWHRWYEAAKTEYGMNITEENFKNIVLVELWKLIPHEVKV